MSTQYVGQNVVPNMQQVQSNQKSVSNLGWLKTSLIAVLVVLILGLSVLLINVTVLDKGEPRVQGVNSDDYISVFLTNGQVYFGHVVDNNSEELSLRDVYFLRVDQIQGELSEEDQQDSTQPQLTLVERAKSLHQPAEPMTINKAHILLTEPLEPESDVISAIQEIEQQEE